MTTASSWVRALLSSAQACGLDPLRLLERVGVDEPTVADRDARIPTTSYLRLFDLAARESGDPSFGARVARAIDGPAFGLLGFVVASAPDLREGLVRFGRYSRLLCDELSLTTVERGTESVIVYEMEETPEVPALFEMAMVHMVFTARRGTRGAFTPVALELRHRAEPRDLPDLVRAPVRFEQPAYAVRCERSSLSLPLRGSNPTLSSILETHAAQVLDALPSEPDLVGRIRRIVRALLPEGDPSLESVAEQLGVGARTLQRRLREEGLTFRALVDEVRRECAIARLERGDTSVAEVAFSLGFSDPSAFTHAFRRWTGRAPRLSRSRK